MVRIRIAAQATTRHATLAFGTFLSQLPIYRRDGTLQPHIFAMLDSETDLTCQIGDTECLGAPQCQLCNGPGSFAVVKSLQTLHNYFVNIYEAIIKAGVQCDTQMALFSSTFAPIPSIKDQAMFLTLVSAIGGGVLGLIPGAGGALGNVAMGVGLGVGQEKLFFDAPQPADTDTILGTLANDTANAYVSIADGLFSDGSFTSTNSDGKTSHTIALRDLMKDGALMQQDPDPDTTQTAMIPQFQRVLFQQLAFFTWQNLQADRVKHMPFIAVAPNPCDRIGPKAFKKPPSDGVEPLDSNITYNGNCYYLLDAKAYEKMASNQGTSGPIGHSCGTFILPGGTNADMDKNAVQFAQLSIADFIVPSVKGWQANNKENG